MKLEIIDSVELCELHKDGSLVNLTIRPGTYEITQVDNPFGQHSGVWFILVNPERAHKKLAGKTIGGSGIYVKHHAKIKIIN